MKSEKNWVVILFEILMVCIISYSFFYGSLNKAQKEAVKTEWIKLKNNL